MMYFTENEIDRMIEDDVPVGDMTSYLMGFSDKQGRIALYARHSMVVSGIEEAARMYVKCGLTVRFQVASGTLLQIGDKMIEAEGSADAIHLIWRTGLAMIEFASGIATRTHAMVQAVRRISDSIQIAGTRKHPPYMKKIALKALLAGGGIPHRTGLSDTLLIFREHLQFTGGYEAIAEMIVAIRQKQKERKIVVEAHTVSEALLVAQAQADIIQLDKLSVSDFVKCKQACEQINPNILLIMAGGVNAANAAEYARAGAEVLVSSWMYFGPPADIKAEIERL